MRAPCGAELAGSPLGACDSWATREWPGLREWWVPRRGGLEHGITLTSGGERVRAELEVDAAGLWEEAGTVWIQADDGTRWSYTGLTAWDASGRALATRLGVEGSAIVLEVDAHGARYPLTLDPMLTTAESSTRATRRASTPRPRPP